LPEPESYESASWGPNPERPEAQGIGRLIEAVPVTALTENFSPRPRMAPPPWGSPIAEDDGFWG
jgi:hypothetical protein